MTAIVGIHYRDGIVVASDSQITHNGGKRKLWTRSKLYPVNFGANSCAILGASGELGLIDEAVHRIRLAIKKRKHETCRALIHVCRDVVKAMSCEWLRELGHAPIGDEQFCLELLLAVRRGTSKPRLEMRTIGPTGKVCPSTGIFDYVGQGGQLIPFVLSPMSPWSSRITVTQAMRLALHAIEEVDGMDTSCGGVTNLWVITKDGSEIMRPRARVKNALIQSVRRTKQRWHRAILGAPGIPDVRKLENV
jgi:20S proteasome alpha/beta subunit